MQCSQKDCQNKGFFDCFACGESRCAHHIRACGDCRKLFCESCDAICLPKHDCAQTDYLTKTLERIERIERVH